MTRDEYRTHCILAMRDAFLRRTSGPSISIYTAMTATFDALHGIAWLVPVEDMADWDEEKSQPGWNWRRMAAAGDLTNPPEAKS